MSQGEPKNLLEGIAIIGFAGRFPGACSVEEFWENIKQGKDTIKRFTDEELERSEYCFASLKDDPNYVRARGILEDIDLFDAAFFGFIPKEAELLDPQHRLFLECAWEALEHAGYDPGQYPGAIGVYAGCRMNTYLLYNLCADRDYIEQYVRGRAVDALPTLISNDKDFLSTRTSYKLNLTGPSVNIQTACSTSLVAVCQGFQSLLSFESDMVLAGGASVMVPQEQGYLYREGRMDSPDGCCRAFDAKAGGTVFGNGVGIVVLKRLEDAVADRDTIYAVIRGAAVNNDGCSKVSYTAPGVDGQAEVVLMAQELAGLPPETITYIETHGTGTSLGDPIEIAALTKAFRAKTEARKFCGVGSVKTNVGHLEFASGVTGLIKTALALKHRLIPPSLHFEMPNPEIDFDNSPFYVVTELTEWPANSSPRRAGVSSFGVGGTNAHVVLEEAPEIEPSGATRPWHLITLSAKSLSALDMATKNLGSHLRRHPELNLGDVCYTLQTGRQHFEFRRFLVCRGVSDAVDALDNPDGKRLVTQRAPGIDPSVVFMFPGQGVQHVNMARDLYQGEPTFKLHLDHCCQLLIPHLELDLRDLLYPGEHSGEQAETVLQHTIYAQLAIFVVEYALANLWMEWGIQPQAMIGHSIGEYVAACVAGIFAIDEALWLLAARARLMQQQPPGSMLSVQMSKQDVEGLIKKGISLAASNAPFRHVLSGPGDVLDHLNSQLTEQGVTTQILHTSHAFHSEMMEPVLVPYQELVGKVSRKPPRIPIVSTLTGTWLTPEEAVDPEYWAKQLRHTVRFGDGVRELQKNPGRVLLEVGPSKTLSTLALQHDDRQAFTAVVGSLSHAQESKPDMQSIVDALGRLWLVGCPVDWQKFYGGEQRWRVPLPPYPFERKRYWVDPPVQGDQTTLSSQRTQPMAAETTSQYGDEDMSKSLLQFALPESPSTAERASGSDRRGTILEELKVVLSDLSGMDLVDVDADKTFLEMGFDSLFLTQVSLAVQNKFAVKITLRLLLGDACSLNDLADYLNRRMPAETFADTRPHRVAGQQEAAAPAADDAVGIETGYPPVKGISEPVPAASRTPGLPDMPQHLPAGLTTADQSTAERVIAQQLEIMRQQLAVLGIAGSPSQAAAGARTVELERGATTETAYPQPPPSSAGAAEIPAAVAKAPEVAPPLERFGPYKPIERKKSSELTLRQQKHLDELIARYTRKTKKSKQMTQEHRPHFADPRAVAGFQQIWKEITYPIISARSLGSKIWDVDGNEYVDLTMGFGTYLFGHSPPFVRSALEEQLKKGIEIGPQSPIAGEVAALICAMSGMERATFCNTGSEAVLGAIRAARTVTGRNKIVVFTGDYHGVNDEVLVRANVIRGNRRSFPIAPGIPPEMVQNVLVFDYGDPASLNLITAQAHQLAAILIEPVQSRKPDLQPRDFVRALRSLSDQSGAALIFDEIVTGFRLHPKGAQAWYGVDADLATYGKVIGGGMPIGVIAGKSVYMDAFDGGMWSYGDDSSPEAGVTFFAGTFVRHPLAMAASLAVMRHLEQSGPQLQQQLNDRTKQLVQTLNGMFEEHGVPIRTIFCGSIFYFSHTDELKYFSLLFHFLRDHGIHMWEGRPCFLSTAHTDQDVDHVISAFRKGIAAMQEGEFLPGSSPSSTLTGRVPDRPGKEAERAGGIPLTEAQREIWLAARMSDTASCAFNESAVLRFRGPFNAEAMKKAIARMVVRHEALRTTFGSDGEFQYIHPSAEIDVPFIDLSSSGESRQEEQLSQMLDEEVRRPFDLEHGPLLRARMVKLEAQYHLLVMTAHHIVCDGWSYDVMVQDLSAVYSMVSEGKEDHRPLPMQISDYALWQKQIQESPEVAVEEDYWLQQFADSVPVLELQSDRQRPSRKSYQGARETQVLDDSAYAQVKQVGAKQGATLYASLLAAYAVLLYRLSGQEEMVVGILAAGQSIVGSHDLVGHCTNLLPLRIRVDGEQSFKEFLGYMKRLVLDAYEHQKVTFGTLINKLNLRRDPSRTPLVSVLFNVDPAIHGMKFKDLDVEFVANPRCAYQFDIGFNLVASDKHLFSECDYTTDLFDAETINRWLGHYHTLITNIAKNPDQPLSTIPLLKDSELQQVLTEWNETRRDYPRGALLHQLFEAQVERVPEAAAVSFGDHSLTYRELNGRANQLAHFLRSLGVTTETLVGVYLERSLDMVVGLLGILKAGGAYLPLDPTFPKDRLAFMLEDSAAPIVLTQAELLEWLPEHKAGVVVLDRDWEAISRNPDRNLDNGSNSNHLAYVMFTSGSTGKPKGVQIHHRAVVNFLLSMQEKPGFTENDILLSVTTLSFDISVLEIFLPLITGGHTVLVSHEVASDGKLLAAGLARSAATVMQATPVTWRILLEAGWENLGRFKALIGGEAVPGEVCDQLLRQGVELWNMYGPTETTIWSTINKMDLSQDRISIGKPIANTQVYVLDKNLLPVPTGVPGELHIGGDGLARGYLNRPELTAEKFIRNPFSKDSDSRIYQTGDLAFFLKDGSLVCLGRTDFQAKVRGFRVEPGEIETLLNRHPSIKQNAVVVRPDSLGENQLVANVVMQDGSEVGVSDLRQYLREQLPDYMVPSRFIFLESLPLTPNGKIDRKALPAVSEERDRDLERTFVAPVDSLEMQLTKIWESVLGVKPIGVKDNFFEIGGHSLIAARLFSRMEKLMGVNLPLATLFQAPTIELLSKMIRGGDWAASWSTLVPIQPGGSKPPLFFVHGAGGNVLLYRDLVSHLGPDQPFYGLQALGLDGKQPHLTRFEDMATRYLKEIRALQPEGPYYLGGYCLGGAIALEMAQQLHAEGQEVSLLAMIETYNMRSGEGVLPFYFEHYHRLQNLKFHWDNLMLLSTKDKYAFLSQKTTISLVRMKLRVAMSLSRLAQVLHLPFGGKYPHVNLTKINDQAHLDYQPKPYEGKITLFRPKKHYKGYDDYQFGWGDVAEGGVEVRVLPVNPRGTLVEPFVRKLADELKTCMEQAT